ncbi:UNVERIFIED_CONTAM: hypothetical protein PYX00_009742 [Menopon gallinae]|uniref:AMOP domain-containing protein n=1 Tax=Menopon gallinae TaxID=328185 RepID=A0AAW2HCT0_9NEOP
MEILKNGVKILSANGDTPSGSVKSSNGVNETLLEKILSSGASKPDLLVSPSGAYKLPIGGNMYGSKETDPITETTESTSPAEDSDKTDSFHDQNIDYDYDYDGIVDVRDQNNRNDVGKSFESSYSFSRGYESVSVDNNVKNILQQIITTLRNFTHYRKDSGCAVENSSTSDPCEKWLACKNHLEKAFIGQSVLPSCPCHYPSTIFYNDGIWDQNQKRFFRWRDASNEAERLDIYKPGAVYCIRSLLAQAGASISSQQCCYDGKLRLLTRGSGAGTVNFVSPDVSKDLHDTVDILPWRLCKGDFTRYHLARYPDNGNRCPVNPNEEQYELQVRSSKYY